MVIRSIAGVSFGVESYKDFAGKGVSFATSHAWQLGRGVIRSLRMNKSPVEEILLQEKGSVLIIAGEVGPIIMNGNAGISEQGGNLEHLLNWLSQ